MCHLFEVFSADIIEMLRIDLILLVLVMSYGFFLLWFVAHEGLCEGEFYPPVIIT